MKEKAKYFSMLTLSTLLIAFGTYFFKFTNNFTFGGITGLAVLVAKTGLNSPIISPSAASPAWPCWSQRPGLFPPVISTWS